MDNHSKEARSYNMSRIRSTNSKPEELVRKFLFANGYRYRKNDKRYPGKPDIVLPKYKTIIFVNGCFWHGHKNCCYFVMPKSNTEYWAKKISRNIERDHYNNDLLTEKGWNVITIWECELKKDKRQSTFENLITSINESLTKK
ncbi:very short patch repair endonuclease [Ruminococcus sp.]|uniref:very short patch repair endonuclease n=1 Tax=Ruminococcus sp. TaxID=41978 RepID=UPI002FDB036C